MTLKLKKITIVVKDDVDADTSWLGGYGSVPKEGCIDRQEQGDMRRNNYRYFYPCNKENAMEDYKRMESLNKRDWSFHGIVAEAEVHNEKKDYSRIHKITSSGLWGIESDGTDEYKKEVALEQIDDLAGELVAFGIMTVGDNWNDMVYEAMKKFEESL